MIIAGAGSLPAEIAAEVTARREDVAILPLKGVADADFSAYVHHPVGMLDPNGVLEGTGKAMRHIKFASHSEVQRPLVRRYIRAAMERAAPAGTRGNGKSVVKSSAGGKKAGKKRATSIRRGNRVQ